MPTRLFGVFGVLEITAAVHIRERHAAFKSISTSASKIALARALSGRQGNMYVCWRRKGHKEEEAVLFANCGISCTAPRSTRWTGVFYRDLSKGRQLSIQRVAPRNRRSQIPIESRGY
jgi:hypothetical protein